MSEPTEFTDFCSPAYRLETVNSACSKTVNLYPEIIEKGPRAGKLRLRSIPGLKIFCTLPDGPVRAMLDIDSGNRLFAVSGATVYEVFRDGTFTAQSGSVALNNHPAIMVTNGFQLGIASAGRGYIVTGGSPAGTVAPILFSDGSDFPMGTITFLDNYFIANQLNSKQIFVSNLAPDGNIWDPGDTSYKEGYPDNIARVFADNEQLWLFGFDSLEVFTDTGGLFPFERIQGAVLKIGCSAPYSVAGLRGYRFWLWKNSVWGAYGIEAQRVSDYGVEEAIKSYSYTADAEAFCYVRGGHVFYVLTFPTAERTWVLDSGVADGPTGPIPTRAWHERGQWTQGQYKRYRPRAYANAFDQDLVGDCQSGVIWSLDTNTYTDAEGGPLRRQRTAPYLTVNNRNIRYNRFFLDCDTGVGLDVASSQPGYDPQVIFRYSDNRGKTWSADLQASLGKIGEVDTRVIFNQLGASRIGKTFDVVVSDPVPFTINAAYLTFGGPEVGR